MMLSSNPYIEEKLTKDRVRDHLRSAEGDRMTWLASQAAEERTHKHRPQMRHLSWVGRLISAIIGGGLS